MSVRFAESLINRPNPIKLEGVEYQVASKNLGDLSCLDCDQDIFLGFFFDGTNNNKYYSTENFSHSNIARLYEVYAGFPSADKLEISRPELKAQKLKDIKKDEDKDWPKAVPQGERCFYRKTYIPGVGTPRRYHFVC
ncbi:hypothetical protein ACFQNF_15520 [Iodobacter arcticus]|uniref:Uncharacterized protein n=1 Tax=Iodobacter arcticus TaxID=590593 RepID=A0ABW2R031_9NEIS